ncbi:hypothetical protein NUU61_009254 [Penicillium alfredii]|uniref:Pentacotripeptide-repeat region of PRORP domain-containing protein n=1 Tax=Penicillium alfredii TaxID=1506179 RepID=A0A9W9JX34_9EURO|nr:uncharacterized protein NUU61_009254 [Penicillium alfredii]KAJ5084675.1 hypothetical protein NUU61_009254 [Penicillium alfredii]
MLERTAGCLENAGRRILRDRNGTIRTRRCLARNFWKHNSTPADVPFWFLALLQTLRSSPVLSNSAESKATKDGATSILDFLYPRKFQQCVSLRSSFTPKRLGLRRRRRMPANLSRAYTTEATSTHQALSNNIHPQEGSHGIHETEAQVAQNILRGMLKRMKLHFDKAWLQYILAGQPPENRSDLCLYLSRSDKPVDQERVERLLEQIEYDRLSPDDFLRLTQSQLNLKRNSKAISICEKAALRGLGDSACAEAFAHYVKCNLWLYAASLWGLRSRSPGDGRPQLPVLLIGGLRSLASFLLEDLFNPARPPQESSTEALLQVMRNFDELGFLRPYHHFNLINAFISVGQRSALVRAIVFYRNFRQTLPDEKPPARLVDRLLESLVSCSITSGILFFLDEMALFWRRPSLEAYKLAMIAFSRAGYASEVHYMFQKLVADHGKPRSRRLVTPLLYVHARLGDVQQTMQQFRRVSEEFGLEPNLACWNIVLVAHATAGDSTGAFSVLSQIMQKGMQPDFYSFKTAMGLCAHQGDIDNIRRLLTEAQKRQVVITMPLVNAVVEGYIMDGQLKLAESFARLSADFVAKSTSRLDMWNQLALRYASRADLPGLNRVLRRIKREQLPESSTTHFATMLSRVIVGKPEKAQKTLAYLDGGHHFLPTPAHYGLVLYGYVKTRNRAMAQILFDEIHERFGKTGLASNLWSLRAQILRDLQIVNNPFSTREKANAANLNLTNVERFMLGSITPPGRPLLNLKAATIGRKTNQYGLPIVHYEYLIKTYGAEGAVEKARELFDAYAQSKQSTALLNSDEIEPVPIRLVTAMMDAHLNAGQYESVEECWQIAFSSAVNMARRFDLDDLFASQTPALVSSSPVKLSSEHPRTSSRPSVPANQQASDTTPNDPSQKKTSEILPSRRFLLSRPLSIYMESLARQNEISKIYHVVTKVEATGFVLSTFNRSIMVRILASSNEFPDQLEAFRVFEDHFIRNFPGWNRILRSEGLQPRGVPTSIEEMESSHVPRGTHGFLKKAGRLFWGRIRPDFMQPTYLAMVHLASTLLRIREKSIESGSMELERLHSVAGATIKTLAQMPYSPDKLQGTLLRGTQLLPDEKKFPPRQPVVREGLGRSAPSVTREHRSIKMPGRPASADLRMRLMLMQASNRRRHRKNLLDAVITPRDQSELERESCAKSARFSDSILPSILSKPIITRGSNQPLGFRTQRGQFEGLAKRRPILPRQRRHDGLGESHQSPTNETIELENQRESQ